MNRVGADLTAYPRSERVDGNERIGDWVAAGNELQNDQFPPKILLVRFLYFSRKNKVK